MTIEEKETYLSLLGWQRLFGDLWQEPPFVNDYKGLLRSLYFFSEACKIAGI
jgi:hypothetical protein